MTLDPSLLLSLLSADPSQRDSQVGQLLARQLAGGAGSPDLSSLLGGSPSQPDSVPAEDPASPTSALSREVQLLDAEVRRLRALVTAVGAALGACQRCLGTEEACERCAGSGLPATSEPDRERFAELIAPAVIRLADEEEAVNTS
jgi:hypothetical protein